jgi:dTDP-4-amino-4,6-dideoxygalactose transaminase
MGFKKDYCPNAEAYFKSVLSIPMFPALTDEQQSHCCSVINRILKN